MKNETANAQAKLNRTMTGVAVRRSGDKTVAVQVSRVAIHPVYHKRRITRKTYLAHDPKNEVQVGQTVIIRACRPLSARKRWLVVEATANQK